MDEVTLYGAPLSYYSGKARAYLRWKGITFRELAPSPEVYKQVIIPAVGYPVIPVVVTASGAVIQDSSDIIDYFEARATGPGLGPAVYPATPRQRLAALLLELYGDEWLLIPAMHYRWAYNRDWVLGEFGALRAPDAPPGERRALGEKLAARFQAMTPALGATPQTIPAIEASYEALLGELDAHFAHYPYLLGTRPSIGDYGLIGPLYAHLYRDPASGALMKRLAPHVADWVERVHNPPAPGAGDFWPMIVSLTACCRFCAARCASRCRCWLTPRSGWPTGASATPGKHRRATSAGTTFRSMARKGNGW